MLRRRPLMRAAATTAVVAGTATAVSGRVRRRQDDRYQQEADAQAYQDQQAYQQQAYQQPVAAPPPAPASAGISPDMMEQLKSLGDLHEQGILTDEEFAAAKAKILG
ncbi:MAG: SHOCT domain-containing protein [Actinomycetota bacterium]|nr:SHOCT domain-containing protein [Actinomycetota bacterium]